MMKFSFIFLTFFLCFSTLAFANGSVTGTVKFEGQAPRPKLIRMDADPMCMIDSKESVYAQSVVLGEGNALANVFVYVKSGLTQKNYPAPAQTAVMDQKGCTYSPRVMGVRVGQKVKFLNPDNTLHNVHAKSKINPEFNAAMPNTRTEMEKVFNKPEFMFPIRCDVHPWMQAWMAVMDHPFFVVTKTDGRFDLGNLPDGSYEIEAWHEKLGAKLTTVVIKNGVSESLDFTFVAPK